jgi:hypothetical protein
MVPKNIHCENYIHLHQKNLILVDSQYNAHIWGQNRFKGNRQLPRESLTWFNWVNFKQFNFAIN